MATSADVLQGTLDLLVLKALSLAPLPRLGHQPAHPATLDATRCRSDRARSIPPSTASSEKDS